MCKTNLIRQQVRTKPGMDMNTLANSLRASVSRTFIRLTINRMLKNKEIAALNVDIMPDSGLPRLKVLQTRLLASVGLNVHQLYRYPNVSRPKKIIILIPLKPKPKKNNCKPGLTMKDFMPGRKYCAFLQSGITKTEEWERKIEAEEEI